MCSVKVLFVCYGNTCRSPMAEAIFLDLLKKNSVESKFEVDSAGLSGWQTGQDPNDYVKMILDRSRISFEHQARQIEVADFAKFDYILGMDLYNLRELDNFAKALKSKTKVLLLGDFIPDSSEKVIEDPYFRDRQEDFEKCFMMITKSCEKLLEYLLTQSVSSDH